MKIIFFQLIAFSVPLAPFILPALILILLIIWLYEGDFKQKWKQFKSNSFVFYLPCLFLLYLFGLLWSDNIEHGLSDIETKLTLLLFPVIILSQQFTSEQIQAIKDRFIEGCLVALLLLLSFCFYNYYLHMENSVFYYEAFSVHLHPSYFALYLNLGLILIIDKIINGKLKIYWLTFYLLALLLFLVSIFLSSSKSGILTLFFSLGLGTVLLISWKRLFQMFLILSVLFIGLFSFLEVNNKKFNLLLNSDVVSLLSDPIKVRFSDLVNPLNSESIHQTATSSSSVRVLVWNTAKELIMENPYFGTGTGDVKDKLTEKYKVKEYIIASEKKLNAHNQFLQTAIALGVFGLILLLLNMFIPLFYAIKYKSWIFLLFILIMIFNFLTESLLERQAGVIFYAFFNSLFLITLKQNTNDPILTSKN
ncbi:MAG: O-antigen ligase family protein [Bacteroidota bacterium]|nr:O-antigen ligase family protein [Bacteroidota bacterium]